MDTRIDEATEPRRTGERDLSPCGRVDIRARVVIAVIRLHRKPEMHPLARRQHNSRSGHSPIDPKAMGRIGRRGDMSRAAFDTQPHDDSRPCARVENCFAAV